MKGRLIIVLLLITLLAAGAMPSSTAQASECTWHVVKRGENLFRISLHYGVSVNAIVRANGIRNPSVIYRGQRLCIPKPGPAPKPSPTPCYKIHVVKRGEYLKIIASRYGTTVTAIVKANGIRNPSVIYVGQRLKIPVKCKPTPKPPDAKPWRGQYFANRSLSGDPKFIRHVSAIDMNWGNGGPPDLGRTDNFSVRWTRTQHFDAGRYLFYFKTKDGVRLLVDGQMLINEWHDVDSAAYYPVEKELSSGNHKLEVEYYNHTGPAQVHLGIERIGPPPPPGPGRWSAKYWNNIELKGSPAWTTSYEDLVFDWGKASPHPSIAADYFSARYLGDSYFSGGKYRFYATVDDGVRIWVDDTLIMDEWRVQARTTFTNDVDIGEGNHKIKVEFFENTGVATLKVLWSKR